MTSIAIAITAELSELATSPGTSDAEPAEPKPSADAAALRSPSKAGYFDRIATLNSQYDAQQARFTTDRNAWQITQCGCGWMFDDPDGGTCPNCGTGVGRLGGMTEEQLSHFTVPAATRFRCPQHDLDASKRGKLRFWTWCACGHVFTIPGECIHCAGSGTQKPETD